MYLPDVNVWIALVFEAHAHHPAARVWFDSLRTGSARICRVTQAGLLRLSTNRSLFGAEALDMSRAWEVYDVLLSDARVSFIGEPAGVEHLWRRRTVGLAYSPKLWTDTYLGAFAEAANLTVATLDKGLADREGDRGELLE